jgi:hypothetical protein
MADELTVRIIRSVKDSINGENVAIDSSVKVTLPKTKREEKYEEMAAFLTTKGDDFLDWLRGSQREDDKPQQPAIDHENNSDQAKANDVGKTKLEQTKSESHTTEALDDNKHPVPQSLSKEKDNSFDAGFLGTEEDAALASLLENSGDDVSL